MVMVINTEVRFAVWIHQPRFVELSLWSGRLLSGIGPAEKPQASWIVALLVSSGIETDTPRSSYILQDF